MTATVLYPIVGYAACFHCGRPISRETRIALAVSTAGREKWLDRDQELCGECTHSLFEERASFERPTQPVTTETEFARYLALGWSDPRSPCG